MLLKDVRLNLNMILGFGWDELFKIDSVYFDIKIQYEYAIILVFDKRL